MKGPWVSGIWFESWSGNVIALNRPTLYTHSFCPFLPCGTMFPQILNFSGDVASRGVSDATAMMEMPRSRGLASTGSPSKLVRYSLPSIT